MKPLRLRIQGFYSYQDMQEIDFEALTTEHLFGIFGDTAAGKSAILEAMTYALYGESERLGMKENRQYNLMNLRSTEMLVEFEFAHGQPQQVYRFTARARRNSKQFGDISRKDRVAAVLENGEWQALPHADGAAILGLSYENFRRAVIIPQGKFQEFLHLQGAERTKMLQEIFHLERYDLYDKTAALDRENDLVLSETEGQLKQVPEVTEAELDALRENRTALEQRKQDTDTDLERVRTEITLLETARDLNTEWEASRARLEKLETERVSQELHRHKLNLYEQVRHAFGSLLEARQDLSRHLQETEATQTKLQQDLESLRPRLKQQEEALQDATRQYEHREEWRERAQELRKIIQIRAAESELALAKSRMQQGETELAALQQSLHGLREKKAAWETVKQGNSRWLDQQEILNSAGTWYQRQTQVQEQVQQAQAEVLRLETEAQEHAAQARAQENAVQMLWEQIPAGISEPDPEQALQAWRSRLEHTARLPEILGHLQERLQEGSPCPVCGATHHADPLPAHAPAAALALLDTVQALQTRLQKIRQEQAGTLQLQGRTQREHSSAQERLRQAQENLRAHRAAFAWPEFPPEDPRAWQEAAESLRKAQQQNREAEKMLLDLDAEARAREEKCRTQEAHMQQLRLLAQTAETQRALLLSQLHRTEYAQHQEASAATLQAKADESEQHYEDITRRYESLKQDVSALKDRCNMLEMDYGVETGKMKHLQEQAAHLAAQFRQAQQDTGLETVDEVQRILSLNLNVTAEREALREWDMQYEAARVQVQNLQSRGADRPWNAAAFAGLAARKETLETLRDSLSQEIGTLMSEEKRLGEAWASRRELVRKHAHLSLRRENLRTLKSMFVGKGFVEFISRIFLQELTARANARFRALTRNQLMLELDAQQNLIVRDYTCGGQTRLVKTLSGGQTFLASLCLALALADSLYAQAGSENNFFFLDEGFGTLDRDTLNAVFETLKSLRRENRTVGVISHVEELKAEISRYLLVTRTEAQGSEILGSWKIR